VQTASAANGSFPFYDVTLEDDAAAAAFMLLFKRDMKRCLILFKE